MARAVPKPPSVRYCCDPKVFGANGPSIGSYNREPRAAKNPLCTATNSNCTTAGATFWGKRHPAKDSLYSMSEPHDAATPRGNLSQVNSKPQTLNNKP